MKIAIIGGIDAQYAIVDIVDYDLPLLDEPIPPSSDGSAGGTRAVEQLRPVMAWAEAMCAVRAKKAQAGCRGPRR